MDLNFNFDDLPEKPKKVKKERTGWRDERLSLRHKEWGWDLPAVDIDFLMVEYDHGICAALIEYKHEYSPPQIIRGNKNYDALIDLGDRAIVPVFACRYKDNLSEYKVIPLNITAKKYIKKRVVMSEYEFVTFLYCLRGRKLPLNMFDENKILIPERLRK